MLQVYTEQRQRYDQLQVVIEPHGCVELVSSERRASVSVVAELRTMAPSGRRQTPTDMLRGRTEEL